MQLPDLIRVGMDHDGTIHEGIASVGNLAIGAVPLTARRCCGYQANCTHSPASNRTAVPAFRLYPPTLPRPTNQRTSSEMMSC
jgi:hypothetical protein